jgi:SAM-dependent methyltransferase
MADERMTPYLRADFSFADFPPHARVLDIGCGPGWHLLELRANGCDAFGVEPDRSAADEARANGLTVLDGVAEQLPVADGSVGGVVCCIVIPYTDPRRAVAEWARVLAPNGEVRASFIGLGYALRYLFAGRSLRERVYGARTVLNTWFHRLTGRRLPGGFGDTAYQSDGQLARYYRENKLERVEVVRGKTYLGLPVLTYHRVRKVALRTAREASVTTPQTAVAV